MAQFSELLIVRNCGTKARILQSRSQTTHSYATFISANNTFSKHYLSSNKSIQHTNRGFINSTLSCRKLWLTCLSGSSLQTTKLGKCCGTSLRLFGTSSTSYVEATDNILNTPNKVKSHNASSKAKKKKSQKLSSRSQERAVPSSRVSRLLNFSGLVASVGFGALNEVTKRQLGLEDKADAIAKRTGSAILTEANLEKIVNTLCRMRGAALKLGQMLSIQDNNFIPPELQKIFERVRNSADFMPKWQLEKVMKSQLGNDWRSKLAEFDDKPFAAASIGQVHKGVLHDGRQVAIKIQYPGVAESINSDIDNLMTVLKITKLIPEEFFAQAAMDVARRELAWEVDYLREAENSKRFRKLIGQHSQFYVPEVIDELTSKQVLTAELIEGTPLDKIGDVSQDVINEVCRNILELCLNELFVYRFMQTDPNWSNFFYNSETKKIYLLDFGAAREYSKIFVDKYIKIIRGSAINDRQMVIDNSVALSFLTGYESKIMINTHTDAVMILGEPFARPEPFDFGRQDTSRRIMDLIPVMLRHRLTPPPEEAYSLHRKMSGSFLLCTKLGAVIECKSLFDKIWQNYNI